LANFRIGLGALLILAGFDFFLAFREGMCLKPKRPGRDGGINSRALPPSRFVDAAVDSAMMPTA